MREGWIYKTFRDYLDKVGVYMVVCWFLKIKKKRKRTNGHQSYIETELRSDFLFANLNILDANDWTK